MTIHITPEPEFSYVSFECNVSETSYDEIIRRVLNTFKPGKFVVTMFANKQSAAANCPRDLEERSDYLNRSGDWLRTDVQYCRFPNYDLTCAFFSRFPSWGFKDASFVPQPGTNEARKISVPLCLAPCDRRNSNVSVTTPRSEGEEYSPPSQTSASPDRNISSTISRGGDSVDAVRSASLPQLTMTATTLTTTTTMTKIPRSKVYRKTSLKSPSLNCEIVIGGGSVLEKKSIVRYTSAAVQEKKQKRRSLAERETDARSENKWNLEDIHITCNPLSTPYPYSTPAATTTTTTTTTIPSKTTTESDEEPKGRSCGSFLPIFALIPHSVISFQYLSPKMKFSWWRNKISWRHA